MRHSVPAVAAFLLLAAPMAAAEPVPTTVEFSAEGKISRAPDRADFQAGVLTNAPTAAEASRLNAEQMSRVVAAIRAAKVPEKDIQTVGVSLSPRYDYQAGKPPRRTGYQASNTVRVRLRDLQRSGAVLDALVSAGANQVNGPEFGLENEESVLDEARRDAVSKARARAELYAQAMGMKLKRVASLAEGGMVRPYPMPMMRMAMADAAPPPPPETPVVPGEVTMSVTFSVKAELE